MENSEKDVSPSHEFAIENHNHRPHPTQESSTEFNNNLLSCLQVLGSFFLLVNSWGVTNTFGAYQTYYEANLLKDQTPSQISWIGSIQAFLLLFVGGLITGPIFDAGHLRGLVIVGSIASVVGMMMTSFCKEYWQVILSQGLCVGVGAGCLFLPSVAVMPQYFTERRAFATGIAAAGSSIGGVVYPAIFHKLQPRIGFDWTTRVIAFIMLATLMIPITVMRAKTLPSIRRPFIDLTVLRELSFDLYSFGFFFGMMGLYIPFYYMSTYSIENDIVEENLGFYLLIIINAASIFGRIVPNFFADTIGLLNISAPFCCTCTIIAFCWTSVTSPGQAIVFCLFYGFFSGTFVSISPLALAALATDPTLVGTHMGMGFTCGGLGLLIGNPVAGLLLDNYGWIGPAMFCGAASAMATVCILMARISKTGRVVMVKV